VGDRGIDERCPPGFWDEVAAGMASDFRESRFTDGIVAAVARVADELARHFPRRPGAEDRNELPDGVSRGSSGTPQ
jgi:putative membrane protein